jgi:alpha-ketoglutarate-dependent taurine dioxygenase
VTNPPSTIENVGNSLTGEHLSAIAKLLSRHGYVYLRGISEAFNHPSEVLRLGPHVPQYHGKLISDVKPEPAMENAAVSANNMKALSPHTEFFEFAGRPPRCIALWCVRPAAGPGGETTLADGRDFLAEFSERDIRLMHSRIYEWRSPASLGLTGISMSARHPILEQEREGLLMRYSSREMYQVDPTGDDLYMRYVKGGMRFFEDTRTELIIERNALLIWDNWRVIHSRNAFTDSRRHLTRIMFNLRPGLDI